MPPVVCPACRGPLVVGDPAWACPACSRSYRSLEGIPDLRTAEDDYLPNEADWDRATMLEAARDRLDFRGLLDLSYDLDPEVTPAARARQVGHILSAPARAKSWVEALGAGLPDGPWLDLGCGSGSFLAAVGPSGRDLVGLDVAMRWLVVARKRLDEEGLDRVPLVCGNAERLPFPDRSFAAVVAGDAIEHIADQAATLAEVHRVMRPSGRLFLATPNRFSLGPEPHVGLWGVGFLPRAWMGPYVQIRRRGDFRAIRTLSYAGWRRMVGASPFGDATISCPTLPPDDFERMGRVKRALALAYNGLVGTSLGRALLRPVSPLFHILATRPADPQPDASPTDQAASNSRT